MLGKEFVVKTTQEAVQAYLNGLNPPLQLSQNNWFTGNVSADHSTITDSTTNITYKLIYTGSPQPVSLAYNLGNGQAYVKGQKFRPTFVPNASNKGLVLGYDQ